MSLAANYYYGSADALGTSGNYYPLSTRARDRVQTDATGRLTYVFPVAFPAGVMPVVQLALEIPSANAADLYSAAITSLSNTQVVIQVKRTTFVTVLTLQVLSVSTTPQCYVHLVASNPTTPPA